MLDAPTGDLAVEQQRYYADRLRDQEATQLGRGYRWYSTAARPVNTQLGFRPQDAWSVFQLPVPPNWSL